MKDPPSRRLYPSSAKCLAGFSLSCKNARRLLNCCYNYFNFLLLLFVFYVCLLFFPTRRVVGPCYAIVAVVAAASSWAFGFGFWLSLFARHSRCRGSAAAAPTLGFIIMVNRIRLTLSRFPLPVAGQRH